MPNDYSAPLLLLASLVACSGDVAHIGSGMDSSGAGGVAGASAESAKGGKGGMASGGASSERSGETFSSCPVDREQLVSADEFGLSSAAASDEVCEVGDQAIRAEWESAEATKEFDVAPLAGTWIDGSGSQHVELVLDATGNGSYLVGNEDALPAIADPYDPFLSSQGANQIDTGIAVDRYAVHPNFRYRVYPVAGLGSEMDFSLRRSQPWDAWCALQTPVRGDFCYGCEFALQSLSSYGESVCGPDAGCYGSNDHGEVVKMHCGRVALCLGASAVCSCTSEECRGSSFDHKQMTATRDPVDPNVMRLDEGIGFDTRYLVRAD